MDSKNILLIVIIAIAGIFVVNMFSGREGLTGRINYASTCTDSDGYDLYKSGYVTVASGREQQATQYTDRSSGGGGQRVMENYCDGEERRVSYGWCRNGEVCSGGNCVSERTSNFY